MLMIYYYNWCRDIKLKEKVEWDNFELFNREAKIFKALPGDSLKLCKTLNT